jgi:hypothetical protein
LGGWLARRQVQAGEAHGRSPRRRQRVRPSLIGAVDLHRIWGAHSDLHKPSSRRDTPQAEAARKAWPLILAPSTARLRAIATLLAEPSDLGARLRAQQPQGPSQVCRSGW